MDPVDVRTRTEKAEEDAETAEGCVIGAVLIIPLVIYEKILESIGIGEPDSYNIMHNFATRAGALVVLLGFPLYLRIAEVLFKVGCIVIALFFLFKFLVGGL